jgi:hypothetical protein
MFKKLTDIVVSLLRWSARLRIPILAIFAHPPPV